MIVVNLRRMLKLLSVAFPQTSDDKQLPEYEFPTCGSEDESPNSCIMSAYRDLYKWWCKNYKVLDIQKARIESLMEDNTRLMTAMSNLKCELNKVEAENDYLNKSVQMLNLGNDNLEQILSESKPVRDAYGLGFMTSSANNRGKGLNKGK